MARQVDFISTSNSHKRYHHPLSPRFAVYTKCSSIEANKTHNLLTEAQQKYLYNFISPAGIELPPNLTDSDDNLKKNLVQSFRKICTQLISKSIPFDVGIKSLKELKKILYKGSISRIGFSDPLSTLGTFFLGRCNEVDDQRISGNLVARVESFEDRAETLSELGRNVLGEVKAALTQQDWNKIENLLPNIKAPHLEYFKPINVSPDNLAKLLKATSSLHLSDGCSQQCKHCNLSPVAKVRSLPFNYLLMLANLVKQSGQSMSNEKFRAYPNTGSHLYLYHDSEPFDYYDPLYKADLGDAINCLAKMHPKQKLYITTRGWYLGNKIAERAASKLIEKGSAKYPNLSIRYSLDLHNIRSNLFRYFLRVMSHLKTLRHSITEEIVSSATQEQKSLLENFQTLLSKLVPPPLNKMLSGNNIFTVSTVSNSRAEKSYSSSATYDVADCMYGYHIRADGTIVFKAQKSPENDGLKHKIDSAEITKLWQGSIETPKPRLLSSTSTGLPEFNPEHFFASV